VDGDELRLATTEVRQTCVANALRQATRALTQRYDAVFAAAGIRSTQFNLLVALAQAPSVPLSRLARAMVMDRTTLTRNLAPLLRRGLVAESGAPDKRVRSYALTAQGRRVLARALPGWRAAQTQILGALGGKDADHLHRILRTVVTASRPR